MDLGASFSLKYARELNIDPRACLRDALKDLCIKRLRLMSYWDLHEPTKKGQYDFEELDWQFSLAKKYGVKVSLAIGLRQPRWPESHWPNWAKNDPNWQQSLCDFIETVVRRYMDHPCLESWQLENEALLKTFGENGDFDRSRLINEFNLVKKLDPSPPLIMTTSDSWGIPVRSPRPDIYGISLYRRFYDRRQYRVSHRQALFYKIRGQLIYGLTGRHVFIHELQAEPWGPKATHLLPLDEQLLTMNSTLMLKTVTFARRTGLKPIYLWGLEWWYWLKTQHNEDSLWETAKKIYAPN